VQASAGRGEGTGALAEGTLRTILDAGMQAAADHPVAFSVYLALLLGVVAAALAHRLRGGGGSPLLVDPTSGDAVPTFVFYSIVPYFLPVRLDPMGLPALFAVTSRLPTSFTHDLPASDSKGEPVACRRA
jgi:hypothetical protein